MRGQAAPECSRQESGSETLVCHENHITNPLRFHVSFVLNWVALEPGGETWRSLASVPAEIILRLPYRELSAGGIEAQVAPIYAMPIRRFSSIISKCCRIRVKTVITKAVIPQPVSAPGLGRNAR